MPAPPLDPQLAHLRDELLTAIRDSAQDARRHAEALVAGLREEIRQELAAGLGAVRGHAETLAAGVREHAEALVRESRRHAGVLFEAVRADVRAVAEGVQAVDEKVERLRAEVAHGFERVDRRLVLLEVRVSALEGR